MIKRTILSVKIKDARALNHVQRDRTKMVIVISVPDRSKTNVLKVNVESKSKIGSVKTVANGVTTKGMFIEEINSRDTENNWSGWSQYSSCKNYE